MQFSLPKDWLIGKYQQLVKNNWKKYLTLSVNGFILKSKKINLIIYKNKIGEFMEG